MATYQTFRNGLPARVSRQFEEDYEQPIKYQVSYAKTIFQVKISEFGEAFRSAFIGVLKCSNVL